MTCPYLANDLQNKMNISHISRNVLPCRSDALGANRGEAPLLQPSRLFISLPSGLI